MAHFSDNSLVVYGLRCLVARDPDGFVTEADFTCGRLTDSAVGELSSKPEMERVLSLNLSWCPITDDALLHLQSFRQLETLNLDYTSVTDDGLRHLIELPRLEYLSLDGTRVTHGGLDFIQQRLPYCVLRV